MIRALPAILVLGACAANTPAPEPAPPPPPPPAEMEVRITQIGTEARTLIEALAARCWLDGIVRGAAMVVDRPNDRIIIDGDSETLLVAQFLPPRDGRTWIRLTGRATEDPQTALKIARSVDKAERTGETACPIAEG